MRPLSRNFPPAIPMGTELQIINYGFTWKKPPTHTKNLQAISKKTPQTRLFVFKYHILCSSFLSQNTLFPCLSLLKGLSLPVSTATMTLCTFCDMSHLNACQTPSLLCFSLKWDRNVALQIVPIALLPALELALEKPKIQALRCRQLSLNSYKQKKEKKITT